MRTPPSPRKRDKRHTEEDPFPVHYHGRWFVVDETCKCGQPRSQHADNGSYGHGAAFNGQCKGFKWHGFVEDPPWDSRWGELDLDEILGLTKRRSK